MIFMQKKMELPTPDTALPGRSTPLITADSHYVLKRPLKGPYPPGFEIVQFGMGCFWGAEKQFWAEGGIFITAVGYSAGYTPNPTYEEVCTGLTGHNEVVLLVFNPDSLSFDRLLKIFWESHNPTQGMRQGNDRGTQYRSGIYYTTQAQREKAETSKQVYQTALSTKGFEPITTEVLPASEFYFAEGYHQQYLAKNPLGYCGLGGTGVTCQI